MKTSLFHRTIALFGLFSVFACAGSPKKWPSQALDADFQIVPDKTLAEKFSVIRGYSVHRPKSLQDNDYPDKHFGFAADEETLRRWLAWTYPGFDLYMMSPKHPYFTKYRKSLKESSRSSTNNKSS